MAFKGTNLQFRMVLSEKKHPQFQLHPTIEIKLVVEEDNGN